MATLGKIGPFIGLDEAQRALAIRRGIIRLVSWRTGKGRPHVSEVFSGKKYPNEAIVTELKKALKELTGVEL